MPVIPSDYPSGGKLDEAPPYAPGGAPRAGARATLMDTQRSGAGRGGGAPLGLGAEAANPQIVAMQGIATVEEGLNMLSAAVPQMAPAFTQLIASLRQVIPQAMADQLAGVVPGAGAAAVPGGPGMGAPAPSAPPPTAAGAPPMPM